MRPAIDFAKYFIQSGNDDNTLDGNMKLQKLLTFANLISYTKTGAPLFVEPMRAYERGCVVGDVRYRYRHDHANLIKLSKEFNPNFNENEYDALQTTLSLFGHLSARELSEIQHQFDFWKIANKRPSQEIVKADIEPELWRIRSVLDAHEQSKKQCLNFEQINEITYYYEPGFQFTDEIVQWLCEFSKTADETSYTIYYDDGELVIY